MLVLSLLLLTPALCTVLGALASDPPLRSWNRGTFSSVSQAILSLRWPIPAPGPPRHPCVLALCVCVFVCLFERSLASSVWAWLHCSPGADDRYCSGQTDIALCCTNQITAEGARGGGGVEEETERERDRCQISIRFPVVRIPSGLWAHW